MKQLADLWSKSRDHLTAVSVIIVVPFIIAGAVVGYLAFHDQSTHESKEEAAKRAAQAEQVSGAMIPGEGGFPISGNVTRIALYNRSSTPVNNVVVTLVLVQGAGPRVAKQLLPELRHLFQRDYLSLPPGQYEAQVSPSWAGMMARPGVELAFTDDKGHSWVRYANGQLAPLPEPPEDYYRLEEPVNWVSPTPLK